MDHDEFIAPVNCGDDVLQLLFRQGGKRMLVDDLDVVRAFGDARVHKCLHVVVWSKSRKWRSTHLGRMAFGNRDASACRTQVGDVSAAGRGILQPDAGITAPHFKLCRDAEVQGLTQELISLRDTKMHMRVDETGQKRLALAVDNLGGLRDRKISTDSAHQAVANENVRTSNETRAVEYIYVAK